MASTSNELTAAALGALVSIIVKINENVQALNRAALGEEEPDDDGDQLAKLGHAIGLRSKEISELLSAYEKVVKDIRGLND